MLETILTGHDHRWRENLWLAKRSSVCSNIVLSPTSGRNGFVSRLRGCNLEMEPLTHFDLPGSLHFYLPNCLMVFALQIFRRLSTQSTRRQKSKLADSLCSLTRAPTRAKPGTASRQRFPSEYPAFAYCQHGSSPAPLAGCVTATP